MNAQEMMINYAANTAPDGFTPQEWAGKMMTEGAVISRTPSSRVVARIRREGKTIIVTETTISQTEKMARTQNGNMGLTRGDDMEETIEVMRCEL